MRHDGEEVVVAVVGERGGWKPHFKQIILFLKKINKSADDVKQQSTAAQLPRSLDEHQWEWDRSSLETNCFAGDVTSQGRVALDLGFGVARRGGA